MPTPGVARLERGDAPGTRVVQAKSCAPCGTLAACGPRAPGNVPRRVGALAPRSQEAFRTLPGAISGADAGLRRDLPRAPRRRRPHVGGPVHRARRPRPRRASPAARPTSSSAPTPRPGSRCAAASSPASRPSRSAASTPAATSTWRSASRACSASPTAARRSCASTTSGSSRPRISTLTMGEGPDVLLLHGLGGDQVVLLRHRGGPQPPLPRPRARLPGFGGSSKPAPARYSARLRRAVVDVMDALEIERAHLVGNSMGGRVAIEVGLRAPDRVGGLALLCPAVAFMRRGYHPLVRLLRPELGLLPAPLSRGRIEKQFWSMFADPDASTRASPTSRSTSSSASTARAGARLAFLERALDLPRQALRPRRLLPAPGRARAAGAVRVGHARQAHPAGLQAPRRALAAVAEQIVLEGCGHVPQIERPEPRTACCALLRAHRRPRRRAPVAGRRLEPALRRGRAGRATTGVARRPLRLDERRRRPAAAGRRAAPPAARLGLSRPADARVAGRPVAHPRRRPRRARPRLHPRDASRGLWLLATLYFRGEVRGLGNIPEEGPVLLVGNHSGGNLTPDTGVFTLAFSRLLRRRARASTSSPTTSSCRCRGWRSCASTAPSPRRARTPRRRWQPARRCSSTPAATTRSTARLGAQQGRLRRAQGLHPPRARARRADRPRRLDRRPGDLALPLARRDAGQAAAARQGCSA